jgi:hypothetical protein
VKQSLTPESILEEIWYGSQGLHLLGAPICVFKGLEETLSESSKTRPESGKFVLGREEHSATSLQQEDQDHWDKARLPSTRGQLTISSTNGTMYHGLKRKEQGGQP